MDDREPVVNQDGEIVAMLTWRDNDNGTQYANIDNGTITRREPDGPVTVACQDTTTGKVTRYTLPDTR